MSLQQTDNRNSGVAQYTDKLTVFSLLLFPHCDSSGTLVLYSIRQVLTRSSFRRCLAFELSMESIPNNMIHLKHFKQCPRHKQIDLWLLLSQKVWVWVNLSVLFSQVHDNHDKILHKWLGLGVNLFCPCDERRSMVWDESTILQAHYTSDLQIRPRSASHPCSQSWGRGAGQ